MKRDEAYFFPLWTFVFAFSILFIVFAVIGMYPFGTKQIMIVDSWHQYYPALQAYHNKLIHFDNIFYSWNTGGGTNFLLLISYYALSPFNLLSVFVPATYLREFMLFITLFKIALGGALFALYLQIKHNKKHISLILFGLSYAFCGFFMGYYWNLMWLDAVALLPLLILGLEHLINTRKPLLYVPVLTFIIVSNFYMAYLVCEFIAFYTIFYYFSSTEKYAFSSFIKKTLRVIGYSLVSVAMSTFILLPVIKGMRLAYGLASPNPKSPELYYSFLDVFNRLLSVTTPAVIDGMPNIAIGTLGLVFVILYFLTPYITTRAKVANGIFVGFLVLSLNLNYLNFAWHGFHFPNQVPYRFAFVISFLLLSMAYQAYLNLQSIPASTYAKVVAGIVFYALLMEYIGADEDLSKSLYLTICLLLVYSFPIGLFFKNILTRDFTAKVLLIIITFEIVLGLAVTLDEAGTSTRTNYPDKNQYVQQALSELRKNDSRLYRVEMCPLYSANDPLMYQYRGISQFSSTANTKYTKFTKMLGLSSDQPSNSYKYVPNTPIANGLLNIEYMLSKNQNLAFPNIAYEKVANYTLVDVYRNRYNLPFAFLANYDIVNFKGNNVSPFKRQEEMMLLMSGQNKTFFNRFKSSSQNYTNITEPTGSGIRQHYKNIDSAKEGQVKLNFTTPKKGQVYLYLKNNIKKSKVTVNSFTRTYAPKRGVIMDLGLLNKGDTFTLEFNTKAQKSGYFDVEAVMFDAEAFDTIYRDIGKIPLKIERFDDTLIQGTINADDNALIYTSIPYEKGWQAYVDGKKVEAMSLNEALLLIPVSKGEHKIELRYVPDGFKTGAIISGLALLLFIVLLIKNRKDKPYSPKENSEASSESKTENRATDVADENDENESLTETSNNLKTAETKMSNTLADDNSTGSKEDTASNAETSIKKEEANKPETNSKETQTKLKQRG